ncbi:MAG: AMP-binding protein [Pseudomonadales bacterium]|jgi:crotonobetaine/carnitine-CoA ligase|tara:strand:+ start:549 stop:2156 length:1608 start_codon:yes stop_codon:yes gene_type:complete
MSLKSEIETSIKQATIGLDIPWMLAEWATRQPDKLALVWEPFEGESKSWSYSQLQSDAKSVAAGLVGRGVTEGDFVLIHLDNCPEFVIAWYACAMLGAVAVSTNTHSVARDLEYFSNHTDAVCAITQPSFAKLISQSCQKLNFIAVTDNDAGVPAEAASLLSEIGAVSFAALFDSVSVVPALKPDPMRNLSVQFTSGTTSRPKAVLWTHANGLWAGKISAVHMRLQRDDVTLVYMPLFHTNAQGYSMLATHWSGGTIVLQPKFSASRFWNISKKHQVTWVSMIPFAFKALMSQPVPKHNQRFWGGPASLPAIGQHFGVDTIGWWGMTETLTQGIVTDHDHPGPHGSIGRVAPEYEIQIRDAQGDLSAIGEKGLLFIRGVRGVSLFKEYYKNETANESAFDDNGWFDTGDLVRSDESGWLFFSDREKDMLKVGAENVAASEIESVIMQTGLVDECAVVAQKHFMLDEVPVVFVIPNGKGVGMDADELKATILAHCEENLASFKVVKHIHLVEELPRSTLEKVAKNELRARLEPITA